MIFAFNDRRMRRTNPSFSPDVDDERYILTTIGVGK
jgi:hypothetical protein